jgi:hypothetical protein
MLERSKDFLFLRESLADAFVEVDREDRTPEQKTATKGEISTYLERYPKLAKESYEVMRQAQAKQSA